MKVDRLFEQNPIIAAVNSDELVSRACRSDIDVVFVLYGTVVSLPSIVKTLKESSKTVIVHADLISGLASGKDVAADFIKVNTQADGIISTKEAVVRRAKELGLVAGMRCFIVDSMALENARHHLVTTCPDFLEVLPGVVYKVISDLSKLNIPIIAGGLLSTREDIINALDSGAKAISSTNTTIWEM